jgi:hypothetical protein
MSGEEGRATPDTNIQNKNSACIWDAPLRAGFSVALSFCGSMVVLRWRSGGLLNAHIHSAIVVQTAR